MTRRRGRKDLASADDSDILKTFEAELRKSAERIQGLLLGVESAGSEAAALANLQEAYRLTHSAKGASRVVGLQSVEDLAHALEGRLEVFAHQGGVPARHETTLFLKLVDGFTASLDAFLGGTEFDTSALLAEFRNACDSPEQGTDVAGAQPSGVVPEPEAAPPHQAPEVVFGPIQPSGPPAAAQRDTPAALRELGDQNAPEVPRRDDVVRVPTEGLDRLFRRVEEAFLIETRLTTLLAGAREMEESRSFSASEWHKLLPQLQREVVQLHQVLLQFHELVRAFRMEPLERLAVPLQRAVRDLSISLGKPAALLLTGRRQLVDASILDALQEPLLHLVRNAVDHGIETPEQRRRLGKPDEAVLEIQASMLGGMLEIRVSDDGCGIDQARVREKALALGLVSAEAVAGWTDAQWLRLVFRSGFSTAPQLSAISGRGLGLDIVRQRVRSLGGDVQVFSRTGIGTTFEIRVPVGLLTPRVLLLRSGDQRIGIPVTDVERVLPLKRADTETVGGQTLVRWKDLPIVVEPLTAQLGWETHSLTGGHVIVVNRSGTLKGYLVDEILGEIEQPALPAPWNLRGLKYLAGLIVMGDGSLVPLIEIRELGSGAAETTAAPLQAPMPGPTRRPHKRLVLVVDDSATIRALHRSILQEAGYEVATAEDGAEAYAFLQRSQVDLVLSDIQMPRMDGLTFTRKVRQVAAWRNLPIIIISQYGRQDDLKKGAEAGADRYIVKSSFRPQQLTEMVKELLG